MNVKDDSAYYFSDFIQLYNKLYANVLSGFYEE